MLVYVLDDRLRVYERTDCLSGELNSTRRARALA